MTPYFLPSPKAIIFQFFEWSEKSVIKKQTMKKNNKGTTETISAPRVSHKFWETLHYNYSGAVMSWFCAGSNPDRDVSDIYDGENLWQWFRLEIRLNAFRRSTIPQKQFIIISIIIIRRPLSSWFRLGKSFWP